MIKMNAIGVVLAAALPAAMGPAACTQPRAAVDTAQRPTVSRGPGSSSLQETAATGARAAPAPRRPRPWAK